ncbi:Hpt domain-containing protein [Roseovarius nanhaiticus]|uniref:Hpt domain-containing protein n=1 Tax=Roseovarius nanhaiticus TaxID=573024 RepID=UPI002492A3D0|nr:Hpt domain-containing protein [Roseovarius nanhaiticus]
MIDWAKVSQLRDEIGAEDFSEVVDLFLTEVEGEIGDLRPEAPTESLEAQLHFLKGSALNLGFHEFAKLCQAGESAAGAGRAEGVDVHAIIGSFAKSKAAFLAGLPRLAP